ncbi:MAG: HAD hydrolase-like protein [Lachnospiraceae bacterium]
MMNSIELAVFDLAGTTVQDDNAVRNCLYKAAQEFNLQATPEEIGDLMGTNKIHLYQYLIAKNKGNVMNFREFEIKIAEDSYKQAKQIYDCYVQIMIHYYRTNCKEVEGASKVFEWCHQNNIKVATGTGFHSDINGAIFDCLGWLKNGLVDYAVDLDMVPEGKGRPAPFMIFKAMEYLNVQNVRSVIKLGDTPADMLEGYHAGCRAVVGVTTGSTPVSSWGKYWHTHVIETVRDLPGLIENGLIV